MIAWILPLFGVLFAAVLGYQVMDAWKKSPARGILMLIIAILMFISVVWMVTIIWPLLSML